MTVSMDRKQTVVACQFDIDYAVPIIDRSVVKQVGRYRQIPVNSHDSRFEEPLVSLEQFGIAYNGYYGKTDGQNPPYCQYLNGSQPTGWLRESVVQKLAQVNNLLRPFGAELLIFDAYRSIECQQSMFDFHYAKAQQKLPHLSEVEWQKEARNFASPPIPFSRSNSTTWLPHMTGAAADLSLRHLASGELLNMGSQFEEITDVSCTDYFERQLNNGHISEKDERLLNRRLLHWAMSQEDFINDSLVYWHYDWGNQLYIRDRKACMGQAPDAAWYGYIDPPA